MALCTNVELPLDYRWAGNTLPHVSRNCRSCVLWVFLVVFMLNLLWWNPAVVGVLGWLMFHKDQHDFAGHVLCHFQEMLSLWDSAAISAVVLDASHQTTVAPKIDGSLHGWVCIMSFLERCHQTLSIGTVPSLAQLVIEMSWHGSVCLKQMECFISTVYQMTAENTFLVSWPSASVALLHKYVHWYCVTRSVVNKMLLGTVNK